MGGSEGGGGAGGAGAEEGGGFGEDWIFDGGGGEGGFGAVKPFEAFVTRRDGHGGFEEGSGGGVGFGADDDDVEGLGIYFGIGEEDGGGEDAAGESDGGGGEIFHRTRCEVGVGFSGGVVIEEIGPAGGGDVFV